jgi:hypothetical protein
MTLARLTSVSRLTVVSLLASMAAAPLHAQPTGGDSLPVTRCDPAANSCSGAGAPAIVLGAAGESTVLATGRQATEVVLEGSASQVTVPGCRQVSPGRMLCGMLQDYHHCRTLLISSMVASCRIGVAFSSGAIEARAAPPGSYDLTVESSARVIVKREERGFGQARGSAAVDLRFDLPVEATPPAWCLQRDQYLYFATGPEAGLPEIEDSEPCDVPLSFRFNAHSDDMTRAWDLCETFAAWDEELEDSTEIMAAAVFHIRSEAPEFAARYPGGAATIAPYIIVKAPLTIDCRS